MVTENIINSQESVITEKQIKAVIIKTEDSKSVKATGGNSYKVEQPERRKSERLKKEIHLSAMDKTEAMAKK